MDCDTTGIEPDMALVKFKKLVGGGSLQIVNTQVPAAMAALGYDSSTCAAVEEFVLAHGNVVGAPGLRPEHYDVFDCALGERAISPLGHVLMMAAAQPFLSGAISKTVNMPDTATVADIEDIYLTGWKLGLKCLAVYRDNCKVGQPLSDAKAKKAIAPAPAETGAPVEVVEKIVERIVYRPQRTRLEFQRTAKTTSFKIGELEGYLVAGEFPDGSLGELFIKVSNHGTTLSGILDGLSLSVSLGLQYGVPLEVFVEKYRGMRFEPAGMTNDPDARMTNSVLSYIFGRLAMDYLDVETRQSLGVYTTAERVALVDAAHAPAAAALAPAVSESPSTAPATAVRSEGLKLSVAKPLCFTCGTSQFMQPAGACFICTSCFSSSGCS
jgi:ribonucleoside-diphosphate reductase alpha chain